MKNILKYFKYCIVGGTGAIIDFALYSLFIFAIDLNYLISNIFSFTFATLTVYYLQKNWTFQYSTNKNLKTINRYFQAVVITYILNNIILIICVESLGIGLLISKIIQILIGFVWGYSANKLYVFNNKFD
jgi:putative flippase GtrA